MSEARYTSQGGGVYWDSLSKDFAIRPWINGKRTWRTLGVSTLTAARALKKKLDSDQTMASHGLEKDPYAKAAAKINELITGYREAGCPGKHNETKAGKQLVCELNRLEKLESFWGVLSADALTEAHCTDYAKARRKTVRQGNDGGRAIDMELTTLWSVLRWAKADGRINSHPLERRPRFRDNRKIRHAREVAPTASGLKSIETWLRSQELTLVADLVCFLAYSGLRIGEALPLDWESIDWDQKLIHVKREKKGIMPWVPILPEMEQLLRDMQSRQGSGFLFPSQESTEDTLDDSAVRRRIRQACIALGLPHVTPHGLRSYFVTQCRESGLGEAEIATLIGDKSGPIILSTTYGAVRPDHLLKRAQKIRLTVAG